MRVFANVKVHITKGEFNQLIRGLQLQTEIFCNYVDTNFKTGCDLHFHKNGSVA